MRLTDPLPAYTEGGREGGTSGEGACRFLPPTRKPMLGLREPLRRLAFGGGVAATRCRSAHSAAASLASLFFLSTFASSVPSAAQRSISRRATAKACASTKHSKQ